MSLVEFGRLFVNLKRLKRYVEKYFSLYLQKIIIETKLKK